MGSRRRGTSRRSCKARGRGSGADVVVLDKAGIGAGAFGDRLWRDPQQLLPARHARAHGAFGGVWESDPEAFAYHSVGYLQIAPEAMHADVAQIHAEQQAIGYASELIEGEDACRSYMEACSPTGRRRGITVVLHEKRGGYANNMRVAAGPGRQGRGRGCTDHRAGVRVTGLGIDGDAVTGVADRPGRRRLRARGRRGRPVGPRPLADARPARTGPGDGRTERPRRVRCGPTGRCRRAPSASTRSYLYDERRADAAGDPRRLRRAPARRRRRHAR